MKFYLYRTGVSLLFIFSIIGCSENDDVISPDITIMYPSEYMIYMPGDSIRISITVSDETQLKWIDVVLTDANRIPVDKQIALPVNSNPQHHNLYYFIENMQLKEGDYYIRVRAGDGTNVKNKYRKIRIGTLTKTLQEVVVITGDPLHHYTINILDTAMNLTPAAAYSGVFSDATVSSLFRLLVVAGKSNGSCFAINMNNHSVKWQLQQGGAPGLICYEKLHAAEKKFFLGYTEGVVRGYNYNGVQQFTATMPFQRIPGEITVLDDTYLVVAEKDKAGTGSYINLYFLVSGNAWVSYKLTDNAGVVALVPLDSRDVMIVLNSAGQGKVLRYNSLSNTVSEPVALPSGEVMGAVACDGNTMLVLHSAGIYCYDATGTVYPWKNGTFSFLRYDPVNQWVFATDNTNLYAFSFPAGQVIFTVPLSDPALELMLVYNN